MKEDSVLGDYAVSHANEKSRTGCDNETMTYIKRSCKGISCTGMEESRDLDLIDAGRAKRNNGVFLNCL